MASESVVSTPVVSTPPPPASIKFSDIDEFHNAETGSVTTQVAPKDIVSLERRAEENYQKQLAENDDDDDDDHDDRLVIHSNDSDNIKLDFETL